MDATSTTASWSSPLAQATAMRSGPCSSATTGVRMRSPSAWSANPDDALDVVQDAFIKAHKYLDKFEGNSSFYTWLYRIVMNLAIDHLRKHRRVKPVELDEAEARGRAREDSLLPRILGGNPGRALMDKEIRARIDQALDELSDNHRAVLVMRELEGLSYEEMAQAMECSKGHDHVAAVPRAARTCRSGCSTWSTTCLRSWSRTSLARRRRRTRTSPQAGARPRGAEPVMDEHHDIELMQLADGELGEREPSSSTAGSRAIPTPAPSASRSRRSTSWSAGTWSWRPTTCRRAGSMRCGARSTRRSDGDPTASGSAHEPRATRGVGRQIAGWLDRYRGHLITGAVSAGAVAALALILRPGDGARDDGTAAQRPMAIDVRPASMRAEPEIESLDTPDGEGTVLNLEDEDGHTTVIWVTPEDTVEGI